MNMYIWSPLRTISNIIFFGLSLSLFQESVEKSTLPLRVQLLSFTAGKKLANTCHQMALVSQPTLDCTKRLYSIVQSKLD